MGFPSGLQRVGGLNKIVGDNMEIYNFVSCYFAIDLFQYTNTRFIVFENPVGLVDMTGNISLRSIIEGQNVFDGTNFLDWEMNLRIVLGHEKLLYTLENSPPKEPPRTDTVAWEAWKTHRDDDITARCIMLAGMNLKFRWQNKAYDACQIMARLKDLHESSLWVERFEVSKKLFRSRMHEGESVEVHVSDMVNCIDRLASLDLVMDSELSVDLILQSLLNSWSSFIMNYNMLNKENTLSELSKMLWDAEPNINKGKKREVHLGKTSRKKRVKTKKP